MDIYARRKMALKRIAERLGGNTKLADKTGYTTGFISQIIGPSAHRHIGEKLARKIEGLLNLKRGALDGPLPGDAVADAAAGLDVPTMVKCVEQVNEALQVAGVKISNAAYGEIVGLLYVGRLRGEEKTMDDVMALIRLTRG